jgi:hypothetical protein
MKSSIFWDITPCSPLKVNRSFGETCRLHLQGGRISQANNQREAGSNADWFSTDYTSSSPRKQNSSFAFELFHIFGRIVIYCYYLAQSVERRATGSSARVRFPAGAREFFYSTASRLVLGPTQPPIQWVPRVISRGIKRPGRESDNSPPSSIEFKNGGAMPLLSHAFSWRCA